MVAPSIVDVLAAGGSDAFGQVGNGGRNYEHPAPVLTEVIRIAAATQGDFPSTDGVSTGSGEVVVFESSATTLAPGDSNGSKDIFARNLRTGVVTRVSLDNGSGQIAGDSIEPAVSARGDLVAFVAPDSAVAKVFGESKDQRDKRIKAGGFGRIPAQFDYQHHAAHGRRHECRCWNAADDFGVRQ
jgi:hypothetical protein